MSNTSPTLLNLGSGQTRVIDMIERSARDRYIEMTRDNVAAFFDVDASGLNLARNKLAQEVAVYWGYFYTERNPEMLALLFGVMPASISKIYAELNCLSEHDPEFGALIDTIERVLKAVGVNPTVNPNRGVKS
jgi:hypothetical protein